MQVDHGEAVEHRHRDDPAVGHHHAELGPDVQSASSSESVTSRPSSMAAAFTGLGTRAPPRPRRLSGRVTTRATSWPARTRVRSGSTAASGVPRNTRRAMAVTLSGRHRSGPRPGQTSRSLPADTSLASMADGVETQGPVPQDPQRLLAHVVVEALDHEHAVEVVDLVLEHPAQELVRPRCDSSLPSRSKPRRWTRSGRTIPSRRPGMERQPSSWYHSPSVSTMVGVDDGLGALAHVVDEQALLDAHLGGGQSRTLGVVHGLDHVLDQARPASRRPGRRRGPPASTPDRRRPGRSTSTSLHCTAHALDAPPVPVGSRAATPRAEAPPVRRRPGRPPPADGPAGRGTEASPSHSVRVVGRPDQPAVGVGRDGEARPPPPGPSA